MRDRTQATPRPDSGLTVAEADERTLIALFRGDAPDPPDVVVGNGDDAAVIGASAATVVTTDMIVEGTHFRIDLSSAVDIGRRAVAQSVSDVLAMGAECSHLVVSVCLPKAMTLEGVADLASGLREEAGRAGAAIIGGDLTTGSSLVLAPTAIGVLPDGVAPVRLTGGRPGDRVALSGRPGRSAAGLELLLAGRPHGPLQDVHRVPVVPYGLGHRARVAGATALTDVTDGLLRDLSGLARASGCDAEIDVSALGSDDELLVAARTLRDGRPDSDPGSVVRAWMLDGGEDHGLLATFPPASAPPAGFRVIGRLAAAVPDAAGTTIVDGVPVEPGGWDSARGDLTVS